MLDCAVLIALGIGPDGKRSILGVSVALSEAEVHWRTFLTSLQKRGLHGVQLLVSEIMPDWARPARPSSRPCRGNAASFISSKTPRLMCPRLDQRAAVAQAIRAVFNCPDRPSAQARLKEVVATYAPGRAQAGRLDGGKPAPRLGHLRLPRRHQRRLRTSNALERVNMELKRRTRVAGLFPNEASLLRLVSALLAEYSDEWETGKTYLSMEPLT